MEFSHSFSIFEEVIEIETGERKRLLICLFSFISSIEISALKFKIQPLPTSFHYYLSIPIPYNLPKLDKT